MPKNNIKRTYHTFNYPMATSQSQTLLTGIRGVGPELIISGFFQSTSSANPQSFIYKGNKHGKGEWFNLSYPSSAGVTVTGTSLYGPNYDNKKNRIQVVGNYATVEAGMSALGCLYEGTFNGIGLWTTLLPTSSSQVLNTIAHSTNGGLVVGNYDTVLVQGKAFIYDIHTQQYFDITNPNAVSITAYGIWHNGKDKYTICGGLTTTTATNVAYVVDWNNKTHTFHNWRTYNFNNDPKKSLITHFDGITEGSVKGTYNLTGDHVGVSSSNSLGFFATVHRKGKHGRFSKKAYWEPISYPHKQTTSGNSVYENTVIGVYTPKEGVYINGYISYLKNKKDKKDKKDKNKNKNK